MSDRLLAFASRRRDELIAGAALVAIELNVLLWEPAKGDRDPSQALDCLAAAAFALPLLWRRRAPVAAPVAMMLVAVAQTIWLTPPPDLGVAVPLLMVAMFSLGFHSDGRAGQVGLAVCAGLATALAAIYDPGDVWFPVLFFFIAPWGAGRALRNRILLTRELAEKTGRLEVEREERAARAVADERARIARELHDVVAHSLTVMVIQAGAARRLVDRSPEQVIEVADTIKRMGREALDEMRRLVGVMSDEGEQAALAPQPTMADIEGLVDRARSAGLYVELSIEGERRELPAGIDLAAYRVVQEALTNTIKHAAAGRAEVRVAYGDHDIELSVSDDGGGAGGGGVPSGGHGLVGMRERVALYGGQLQAGGRDGGGYEVRARIPLAREEALA